MTKIGGVSATPPSSPVIAASNSSTSTTKFEIERRFLVRSLPDNPDQYHHEYIEQGYFDTKGETSARIRKKGEKYYQTFKSGSGKVRKETEIELSENQFTALWPLTAKRRLEKTRYEIPYGVHIIELDIYHGKLDGFKTVEVEFKTIEDCDAFNPPSWFGAEVTSKKRYTNKNLAKYGIPKEKK